MIPLDHLMIIILKRSFYFIILTLQDLLMSSWILGPDHSYELQEAGDAYHIKTQSC